MAQFIVGEAVTSVNRDGVNIPLVSGVGVNIKTGDTFPAVFSDRGPDMDLRLARTLTGGEKVRLTMFCTSSELKMSIIKVQSHNQY